MTMNKFLGKLKAKDKKNSITVNIGANITICKECEKLNKGVEIYNMFMQGPYHNILLKYDKENHVFLVNENALMGIIQSVNPLQEPRKIQIVSQKEWMNSGA
ncbi:hypothetical protein SAMN02745975_00537 [Geosporobacter subterraneus DSM 17957]|uniref:Uncharacterized protein n=1 Tax=Geosporobacter subterraneus DSM 17957 TaxID=1121919 RepID=A0A1M6DQF3_9FIRM|nr:hypothetical protein [Geosporobacter subterraneus]SHI75425.1 hypothetical protein SAMN02745975_00537 [Geosporobacter subterraneus DSM 17957]